MPNSVITSAGLALFADALHTGATVTIDRIVFADVPGLDPAVTPGANQAMPPAAQIMLDAAIEKAGRVDANTVVYSRVLTATDGNWYINWIGLYSTQHKTLVAVCVVPRHYKFKTDGFRAGNTLYKNFAIQYANAAALTGITIAPETWQYDFDTRYALKDHNHDTKYEPLGAVASHNEAATPHPGKFAAAGHNHDTKYEAKGAVATHNAAADAHPGKFAAAGHNHNTAYEAKGAVETHNAAADAHPDIRAQLGAGKAMFEIFSSLSGETPPGAYPLWTGETIANCRTLYPDFWAKAVSLQSSGKIRTLAAAAYNTEISTYGETGAFVIDTDAGSIRLPKIVHFVRSIADLASIGTAQNDELRAHTHTTPNGTLYVRPTVHAPGADGDHWHNQNDGSNVTGSTGGGETRPKNVRAAMYIQVYSAAIPASTAQAAEFVNAVTGKANRNFDNLELSAALSNLGVAGSLSPSGYQKLPGGLILQWGYLESGKGTREVVFPVKFPARCGSISFATSANVTSYPVADSVVSTGFSFYSGSNVALHWIAIGY